MNDIDLVVPDTIDEARLQLVRQLHRAVYGDVWARPESPEAVWKRLLDVVRVACQNTREPWNEPRLPDAETSQFPGWNAESSRRLDRLESLLLMTIGQNYFALNQVKEDRNTQFGAMYATLANDVNRRRQ